MISVLGVKNSDNRKIIYTFFSGSALEEPDFATFPLMQDGSTWDTLDTTGDKAKIVRHVLVGGVWVEYEDGASGGDTPTPTPTGYPTLTYIQAAFIDNETGVVAEPRFYYEDVLNEMTIESRGYRLVLVDWEPSGESGPVFDTTMMGYARLTVAEKQNYPELVFDQWKDLSEQPAYIDTGSGGYYTINTDPSGQGDQTLSLTVVVGYKADADSEAVYAMGTVSIVVVDTTA